MNEKEIKVGLSNSNQFRCLPALKQMNKEIEANKAAIAKLKKAPPKKK